MHIFLTGPLQSGKSTAIARYLAGRPESPGGFRTRWDRAAGWRWSCWRRERV